MIEYFDKNNNGHLEVIYTVKLTKDPNVIHKIFHNDMMMKIMYCIGLISVERGETKTLKFELSKLVTEKLSILANFLTVLIDSLKKAVFY